MRAVLALSSTISFTCCGSSRVGLGSTLARPSSNAGRSRSLQLFMGGAEEGSRKNFESVTQERLQLIRHPLVVSALACPSVVCSSAASVEEASAPSGVEFMEVLVKAAVGHPDKLGDCPFSQRVLLTLEEKGIPYHAKYVDTSNKPQWFLEANPEGKVPVIKHEGKWVADSDVITALLEDVHPEPSLKCEDNKSVGSGIFGAFNSFLKSKDSSDGTEQALVKELTALEAHLKTSGPYINGEKVCSVDLALAPKLYHMKVALGYYKQWAVPADLPLVSQYIEVMFSRQSFLKTKAPEEFVVKGWEAKVNSA